MYSEAFSKSFSILYLIRVKCFLCRFDKDYVIKVVYICKDKSIQFFYTRVPFVDITFVLCVTENKKESNTQELYTWMS